MESCLHFASLNTMKVEKTKTDEPVFLVLTFISHLQLKNTNLMGQVASSITLPVFLTSLYHCKKKAVKFFPYYYIFQRITILPGLRLCLTSFSAIGVLYA